MPGLSQTHSPAILVVSMVLVEQASTRCVSSPTDPASQASSIGCCLGTERMWRRFADPPSLVLRPMLGTKRVPGMVRKMSAGLLLSPCVDPSSCPSKSPDPSQQPTAVRPALAHEPASFLAQPEPGSKGMPRPRKEEGREGGVPQGTVSVLTHTLLW